MKTHIEELDEEAGLEEGATARVGDRLVAFLIDGLLLWTCFYLTLRLTTNIGAQNSPHYYPVLAAWVGLYLGYQAFFSSEGRQTLGKSLVGLRVVDLKGRPLDLQSAALRAFGYLPSCFFNLGFLWATFHPDRRGWHDLLAGSMVVETHGRSPLERGALTAAAALSLMFLGGAWTWQHLAAEQYYNMKMVAYANLSLEELGRLEELYKKRNGTYTANVMELAGLAGDPVQYLSVMSDLLHPAYGINIQVQKDGYTIAAVAKDEKRTRIKFSGPLRKLS